MPLNRITLPGPHEFVFVVGLAVAATAAHADVVISSQATKNMSCSGGVCAPTAKRAVLNVSDLEGYLASGNVEVTTTGSNGAQANNIAVDAALSWSDSNALSLIAADAITINREITVAGPGRLSLTTPSSTLLSFGRKGHVVFQNLSSQLNIDGTSYTLVNDVKSLAAAIANNPSGAYALVNDYDASADGTYMTSPIQTTLTGDFDGLGNTISRLSIKPPVAGFYGLFELVGGYIGNLRVRDATIVVSGGSTAGIISAAGGYTIHVFASGTIVGKGRYGNAVGGLSGGGGTIVDCSAEVKIIARGPVAAGGLVQGNGGSIDQSVATGLIVAGSNSYAGGLAEANYGSISNSYSTAAVVGGAHSKIGGFVGENSETNGVGAEIRASYSTGAVSGGAHSRVGGFAGSVYPPSGKWNKENYWDVDTSGTNQGTGKGNKNGIFGLTTSELQSGLPEGFNPKIWAQDPKINNGFPYLIANPPPK